MFKPLTYSSNEIIPLGQRVEAPLRAKNSLASGVVLAPDPQGHKIKNIKAIAKIDSGFPPLSEGRLKWIQWLSHYYHYPVGLVAAMSFPPLPFKEEKAKPLKASERQTSKGAKAQNAETLKSPNKSAEKHAEKQGAFKDLPQKALFPLTGSPERSADSKKPPLLNLTLEQKQCGKAVMSCSGFQTFLLCGVTGSGKTEVYKMIAEKVLSQEKQALIMLPEIFLTPQILSRFSEAFPNQTAAMHSQLTPRQKTRSWRQLLFGEKSLLVGTRSALFCPLPRLGLIVVDEEHDSSFKQDSKLLYHARDSAIMLAKILDIPIVLGSATPSLTSLYQAKKGNYHLLRLTKRARNQPLPKMSLADLKTPPPEGHPFWLSGALRLKIEETLAKGKQAALFLNRRGKAAAILCSGCGHVQKCPNCEISLTLHGDEHLLCHYCSYLEKKPALCPSCRQAKWFERGLGTEGVERALKRFFPKARIIRADRDAIDSRAEMEAFLQIVEQGKADLIIGTQMIAKGLDFPSIALVGLLLADMGFHFPDFRASERTLQILLQMAGRAGRKDSSEAVLQTFSPEHPSLLFAKSHDYLGFAEEEMKSREKLSYPPFSRLCLFRVDSAKQEAAREEAAALGRLARKTATKGMAVLGPGPAPLFKIRNRYRFQLLIKAPGHSQLQSFLNVFLKSFKPRPFVQAKMDRDPVSML